MSRIAYADPPYIGQAAKHYKREEVDHRDLLAQLRGFDGWALSASSPSLEEILCLCREVIGPNRVRVASWVKPFASFKPGVNPAYAWEPVIFVSARKRERTEPTVRDWVSANITMKKGLSGAKPEAVCNWLFDLIGARPGIDEFSDMFPGTGIVSACWARRAATPTTGETP